MAAHDAGPVEVEIRTVSEALDAFGRDRLPRCDPLAGAGLEAVLNIIASFCDDIAPDLLDPLSRRRLERRGQADARDALDAAELFRLLGACARLFPYQIVAGSGVLETFRDEVPRLVRWLGKRRIGNPDEQPAFAEAWTAARPVLAQHIDVQRAIEDGLNWPPQTTRGEVVVGRFVIQKEEPFGIWVFSDGHAHGPVRVPRPVRPLFAPGHEASLAFQRATVGWSLLGAALPCPNGGLEKMIADLRR